LSYDEGVRGTEVREWIERFEAAEALDRKLKRQRGPNPDWSITLSLSLIAAARQLAGGALPLGPGRAQEDEQVRRTWEKLRARLDR
jgi:hypothetical protein